MGKFREDELLGWLYRFLPAELQPLDKTSQERGIYSASTE